MGMFDSVYFTCPHCGASLEEQSKAGECCLGVYHAHEVPAVLAADINGNQIGCHECGRVYTITAPIQRTVKMELAPVNIFPSDEE